MAHLSRLCESLRRSVRQPGHAGSVCVRGWRLRLPASCPLCKAPSHGGALCKRCHHRVTGPMHAGMRRCARCRLLLAPSESCPDCMTTPASFDGIIAAFDYDAPSSLLIHRLKVQRRFTDVPMLAGLLADAVRQSGRELPSGLVLVPVPAGARSVRLRGFNPAAEIARGLARRLDRPCRPGVLRRVHGGPRQATLSREARMVATAHLYQVAADVRGARLAIVDDVLTTGSTMHSIARMLKRAGAVSVHGLVLARTQRRTS